MFTDQQLDVWTAALRRGDIAAAPAEGVYGYCADPFSPRALQALLALKKRDSAKGFIVLVAEVSWLEKLCPPLPEECRRAVAEHWQPGRPPTTLILPAAAGLPPALTGAFPTLAVRLPQPVYMKEYLQDWGGPLVSTSLNESGQPPATHAGQIPAGIPALTLENELSGLPSRIYNPLSGEWLR